MQLIYARLLEAGARLGLLLLAISFVVYMAGWLTPHVASERLPELWTLPLSEFLKRSATPTGWSWLAHAHRADLGGLVGIAVLAACSLPPLAAVTVLSLRQNDRILALLGTLQILVVLAAASGLLTAGH